MEIFNSFEDLGKLKERLFGITEKQKEPIEQPVYQKTRIVDNTPIDLKKKFTKQEKKEIIRKKIERYLSRGWSETWFEAARRASQEMMPEEKFEIYSQIVLLLAQKFNMEEITRANLSLSTNRYGEHSWYFKIPNTEELKKKINDRANEESHEETYGDQNYSIENERIPEEFLADINSSESLMVKISDHVNRTLQHYSKQENVPIITTYEVDMEQKLIRELSTIDNIQLGLTDNETTRASVEVPFTEIENYLSSQEIL
jgi:hypothetical protein